MGRDIQYRLGQDQAVGRDDHYIGFEMGQFLLRFFRFEAQGLKHGNVGVQGHLLDRARHQFAPSPGRAVRLTVNADNVMAGLYQGFQGSGGKIRGSGKNDAHGAGSLLVWSLAYEKTGS